MIGTDPYFKETEETKRYVQAADLDTVIREADILSVHCPAEGNQNLINRDVFARMKNTAVVINVARAESLTKRILTGRWNKRRSAEQVWTV